MKKKLLLFLILSIVVLLDMTAQCTTTSLVGGHIIYNDISINPTIPWNNLPGAETSDNIRCVSGLTVGTNTTPTSSGIWAQTFLFNVPSGAIICGVEVRIERRQVGAISGTSSVIDKSVKLINSMTIVGTEHATATPWASSDQIDVYGGPGDLWGLNLTPAIINAPDFGVALTTKFQNTGAAVTLSAQIDKISIMVYYTVPLPVELMEFEALADGRNVNIHWNTASEKNNAEFIIERSLDAINWTTVATISGAGTVNSELNYSWIDQNAPVGTIYYNLKQKDFNGDIQHLGSTTATVTGKEEVDFYFDQSNSTIKISGFKHNGANLCILDISGKPILNKSVSPDQIEIFVDKTIVNGIYFIELITSNQTVLKKILVAN